MNEIKNPHVKWLREVATILHSEQRTALANTCEGAACEIEALTNHRGALLATLPTHLQENAPYKQCNVCERKSWEDPEHEAICWMLQPSGENCAGVLRRTKGT